MIDELIPSPNGELLHSDVRLKINEIIPLANGMLWLRKTASYDVAERFARLDMFPSADNQIVKLPDPSGGDYQVDVFNQTNVASYDIIVQSFAGVEIDRIKAGESYSFFQNDSAPLGDVVALNDKSIPELDVATYGNFNALDWASVPSGGARIVGNGNQFSNLPDSYVLDPTVPYECEVMLVNESNVFSQTIVFTTGFTPSSTFAIGRRAFRGGGNLGAAITLGWSRNASIDDLVAITNNRIAIGNTVADNTGNPNPGGVITLNLTTNGGDELLTPPSSPQPITGGDYNGYVPVALNLIEQSGALSFSNGSIVVGAGGAGKYRSSHAWIDMSCDTNANNIGFVFGIQRGSQIFFSPRVTGDRLSQGNDRTNVSGGGFVQLEEGDVLTLYVASELNTELTIYDANLGIEMTLPAFLDTI